MVRSRTSQHRAPPRTHRAGCAEGDCAGPLQHSGHHARALAADEASDRPGDRTAARSGNRGELEYAGPPQPACDDTCEDPVAAPEHVSFALALATPIETDAAPRCW